MKSWQLSLGPSWCAWLPEGHAFADRKHAWLNSPKGSGTLKISLAKPIKAVKPFTIDLQILPRHVTSLQEPFIISFFSLKIYLTSIKHLSPKRFQGPKSSGLFGYSWFVGCEDGGPDGHSKPPRAAAPHLAGCHLPGRGIDWKPLPRKVDRNLGKIIFLTQEMVFQCFSYIL